MNGEIFKEKRRSAMFEFFGNLLNKTEKKPLVSLTNDRVFIKHIKSKGPGGSLVALTVADVKKGYIVDFDGYKNEIVLFLRKNKEDR